MAENYTKGDIIANPNKRTAMWRVLDVNNEQYRLIRCGKDGRPHSMVKDQTGKWQAKTDYNGFTVIGKYNARSANRLPAKATPKTGGPRKSTAVKTETPVSQAVVHPRHTPPAKRARTGGTIKGAAPQSQGLELFLVTMETFHNSSAEGFRKMSKELSRSAGAK